jgi:D-3-phosphoglycerate dehydrogenase
MDILVTEDLQSPAIDRLAQKYKVRREPSLWKDAAGLKAAIGPARAILVRNQTQVTAEVLAAAPNLRAIGRVGVGLDNIDVAAATKLGVVVVAPLNANAVSVAELAMGLVLALARKIPQADHSTKAGGWDRKGCTGIELEGKLLGLCGFGRIGRLVGARARAFGMRLAVFDPYVKADAPALRECETLYCAKIEELLAVADFVSVHLPLTPETRHLFNARGFSTMKRGSFFINTSRGGVMDEKALLDAVSSGQLAGAGLDVREAEPPPPASGLENLPNVILTPHVGAFTVEAQRRTFEAVASDVDLLLSGQAALNYVNMDRPKRAPGRSN